MPDRGEEGWGEVHAVPRRRQGLLSASATAQALEAECDRWFLWIPVLFAGGIITYFTLTDEPSVRLAFALVIGALGLCLFVRQAPLGICMGGAALAFAFGFAAAKLRTEMVRAPVLSQELRYVRVTGFVETHELRDQARARLTLRVLTLGELEADKRPYRVRVTLSAKEGAATWIGEAVALQATLQPPPEPVAPGAFDFARQAWFDRLGATGYATSRVTVLDDPKELPWDLAAWARVDRLRGAVNARVRAALPGQTGEIACALITGDRGGISKDVTEAMRDSGLAHILAISGLHMAVMAGTVFWLVRALLACVPWLALRCPIKKWSAVIALCAASLYLALSGASVPTVRSWIMMSILLIAVMLDRPALTMRNVALAALIILIAAPESLFDPSFEMSFAAVIALVALYEWLSARRGNALRDISPFFRGLRKGGSLIAAAAITTLVAGTAIAPFALYHFHRMTHYGLVANLVAAPLVSLLIMPMALFSLLAMPFGLEALPLKAMGFGIELMVATGKEVASWPGAVSILPQISGAALVLIVLGGVWLCLWQTRIRSLGLMIAAVGLTLAPHSNRPDVLIERSGATAALRSSRGDLIFPPATAADYSVDNWLLADGDERGVAAAADESAFRCDSLGCIGKVKGKTVALIRDPGALEEDCRLAEIVIAPFTIGAKCRAARVIVDRRRLKADGAHALYIEGLSIRTETVAAARGRRPWVPDRAVITAAVPPRAEDEPDRRLDGSPDE